MRLSRVCDACENHTKSTIFLIIFSNKLNIKSASDRVSVDGGGFVSILSEVSVHTHPCSVSDTVIEWARGRSCCHPVIELIGLSEACTRSIRLDNGDIVVRGWFECVRQRMRDEPKCRCEMGTRDELLWPLDGSSSRASEAKTKTELGSLQASVRYSNVYNTPHRVAT